MDRLADSVIGYMRSKNYVIFEGANQYNIVYLEGVNVDGSLNADVPNHFNDRRLVIQVLDRIPSVIGNWEGTSEPGSHYTRNPMNHRGAARICFGQYKAWSLGMHGQTDRHEALVQVQPLPVARDGNRDFARTGDYIASGLWGINQHWGYDLPTNNIQRASAGCLVGRTRAGHREFMQLVKKDAKLRKFAGYVFTTTIIPGDDLLLKFPLVA